MAVHTASVMWRARHCRRRIQRLALQAAITGFAQSVSADQFALRALQGVVLLAALAKFRGGLLAAPLLEQLVVRANPLPKLEHTQGQQQDRFDARPAVAGAQRSREIVPHVYPWPPNQAGFCKGIGFSQSHSCPPGARTLHSEFAFALERLL